MGRDDRSTIGFQVDEEFRAYVERRAAKLGMTTTAYLRMACLWEGLSEADAEALKFISKDVFKLVASAIQRKVARSSGQPS